MINLHIADRSEDVKVWEWKLLAEKYLNAFSHYVMTFPSLPIEFECFVSSVRRFRNVVVFFCSAAILTKLITLRSNTSQVFLQKVYSTAKITKVSRDHFEFETDRQTDKDRQPCVTVAKI